MMLAALPLTSVPATALPEGLWGYLFLLAVAVLVHEPWRWLGVALGRDMQIGSPLFQWVRAVAIALVAALIMRLTLFPAGALGAIPTGVRVGAFAIGVAAFFIAGRRMAPGVLAGALALVAGAVIAG